MPVTRRTSRRAPRVNYKEREGSGEESDEDHEDKAHKDQTEKRQEEDGKEEDEDDNADEESDYEKTLKPTSKRPVRKTRTTRSSATKQKARTSNNIKVKYEDESEEEIEEDEEEEEEEEKIPKRRFSTRKNQQQRQEKRRATSSSKAAPRGGRSTRRTAKRATQSEKVSEDEIDSDEDGDENFEESDHDSDEYVPDDDEDRQKDDDDDDEMVDLVDDDDEIAEKGGASGDEDAAIVTPRRPRPSHTGDHDDGEYEFDPDSDGQAGDESGESNDGLRRESPRNVLSKRKLRKRRSSLKPVRLSMEINAKDSVESGDDGDEVQNRLTRRRRKSSSSAASSVSSNSSKHRGKNFVGESSISSESENDDVDESNKNTREYHMKHRDEPERKPFKMESLEHSCSKVDIVTYDPLEKNHVVWKSESGKAIYCYNLSTLRQVAISKRMQWMEPPTFLKPMSSETKEQIVKVFGEDALDLNSHDADPRAVKDIERRILKQVWEVHFRLMGKHELHICPICYELAVDEYIKYRKEHPDLDEDDDLYELTLEDHDEPQQDKDKDEDLENRVVNPLHVLDHYHDWDGAAAMSFLSYMGVKGHLKEVHGVSVGGREEKSLVNDYRLRATDGLVQKFVSKKSKFRNSGNWAVYFWKTNTAYAGIFNMLIDKVEAAEADLRERGTTFPRSVLHRKSKGLWKDLTSNLGSNDEEELAAFFVDDDDVSSEDDDVAQRKRSRTRGQRGSDDGDDGADGEIKTKVHPSLLMEEGELEHLRNLKSFYAEVDEREGSDDEDDYSEDEIIPVLSDQDESDSEHESRRSKNRKPGKSKRKLLTPSKRRASHARKESNGSGIASEDSNEDDDDHSDPGKLASPFVVKRKVLTPRKHLSSESDKEGSDAEVNQARLQGRSGGKRRVLLDDEDEAEGKESKDYQTPSHKKQRVLNDSEDEDAY
mmetsp:Transcript_15558/g.27236  ORF Transcript_15558/g.27236 Transcript_15558/m.27236 type:complete len:938 (+) Transcript_15558:164-2977(+)